MATRELLSGSTDGLGIKVTASATPGTLIHTAHATSKDHLYLWATNADSAEYAVTVEFGGTTSPDNTIEQTIQGEDGLTPLVEGLPLTNSLVVRVFSASGANQIIIYGYVNRV